MIEALLPVANVLGRLMIFFSLAYVMPIAGSLIFNDGIAVDFVIAMLMNLGFGAILTFATQTHYRELKPRDGFLLVTLAWVLTAAVASLPLLIVYPELTFTDAFFEMISAMTTTGATILTGLDDAPQSINLWRHQLQWLGGLGIIVLAVAILPLLGVGGMQLYKAEAPGPMKDARLTARIAGTARIAVAVFLHARGVYVDFWTALRHASFNTVSLATTSGYASVDYDQWPIMASLWILLLSGYASCSGSTGGGIKMVRTIVLWKESRRGLHRLIHPKLAEVIKVGELAVPNKVAFAVLGFLSLYTLTAITMTLLLLATGMDLISGASAVIACINNAGPGLGTVGPARNYAGLTDFQTWVLAATMLLGRLEILSMMVIFTPGFWRK